MQYSNIYIYIHNICVWNIYKYTCIYGNMVFATEGFLEVAIESKAEWDLNPQPLNSIQTV